MRRRAVFKTIAALGVLIAMSWLTEAFAAGGSLANFPNPAQDLPLAKEKTMQTAVLAGGCFWCTEAVYEEVEGVTSVVSGYAGGTAASANYKAVSMGKTDHAECIQITFDASKISYGQLLKIFFSVAHDPTTKDRQGPDWGRQYRSAVFYANEDQKRVAQAYIAQLNQARVFSSPIVTEVSPLQGFYVAEEYHQDYAKRNPYQPYVMVNSLPKVEKVRKTYPNLLKQKSK